MTLFTAHYGLEESRDLTRWRELVEFYSYIEGRHNKVSYGLEVNCEEKRGINDKYKLFVLGTLKKRIAVYKGPSEGARLCLVISSSGVDKLK